MIVGSLKKEPQYNNQTMALYEKDWTSKYYLNKRSWEYFVMDLEGDTQRLFMFFFGFPLAIPSLAIVFLIFLRRQKVWLFLMAVMTILGSCAAMTCMAKAHYFATETCLVVLLITAGLRIMSLLKFGNVRVGFILVNCLILAQLVINMMNVSAPTNLSLGRVQEAGSDKILNGFFTRQELSNVLLKIAGKHLVIIQYVPGHIVHFEWVYNDADIDHSPIVWAREMGMSKDEELLGYFKDRQVWYVQVGGLDRYPFREYDCRYGLPDQFEMLQEQQYY